MNRTALIACVLLWGGLSAPSASEEAPRDSAHPRFVEAGQALYRQHCAVCHGMEGRGDGVAVSALKTPPADLTRIAARRGGEFPAGEVAMWIDGRFESAAHGSREMPIWGNALRDAEPRAPGPEQEVVRGKIDVLVDYLRTLQVEGNAP